MRKSRLSDPLKRPQFRRLAASYAVNELGDWMGIVALSVLVYDRTGSAMATAGLFFGTRFLPALLAPLLVARIERPPPRYALPAIYCGEAAAFAALALLADHFSLAAVIAIAAVDGALALTGRALTRAVVAGLLEPTGELRAGNAILNVAFTAGAAVGPGIAGLIVAGFGVQSALLLDAASFYLVACILLSARSMPEVEPEGGDFAERLRAGLAYIGEKIALKRLLIAQGIAFVFFAAVLPIEVIYAKEVLGAGDSGYGLLLASWGVGMVFGSLVFAYVRRAPLPSLLFFSTLVVAAGYLGLAAAPTLDLAQEVLVVVGCHDPLGLRRGSRGRASTLATLEQPEEGVDESREEHDDEQDLSHTPRVGAGPSRVCRVADYPGCVKEFFIYTAARLGVFLASYAVVVGIYLLVTGDDQIPLIWPFLVAVVISAFASIVLLRRQREAFAHAIQHRADRASSRLEQMRAKEDEPES